MSVCKYSRQLNAYHDGELSSAALAELERHLESCPPCTEELERLTHLSQLLAGVSIPEMSAGVPARLHGAIGSVREVVVVRMAERLIAVAATVLVVCGLWLWHANGASKPYDGPLEGWEIAAMTLEVVEAPDVSPEELLTQWIVTDLSRENGSD